MYIGKNFWWYVLGFVRVKAIRFDCGEGGGAIGYPFKRSVARVKCFLKPAQQKEVLHLLFHVAHSTPHHLA